MRILSLSLILILFTSGCSMLENLSVENREKIINKLAKNGVYLALTSIYEEDEKNKRNEIAWIIKEDISRNVINVLSNQSISISKKTFNKLFENVPPNIRPFLVSALDILEIAEINVEEAIGEYPTRLAKAFFNGIIEGCEMTLGEKENVVEGNSG